MPAPRIDWRHADWSRPHLAHCTPQRLLLLQRLPVLLLLLQLQLEHVLLLRVRRLLHVHMLHVLRRVLLHWVQVLAGHRTTTHSPLIAATTSAITFTASPIVALGKRHRLALTTPTPWQSSV